MKIIIKKKSLSQKLKAIDDVRQSQSKIYNFFLRKYNQIKLFLYIFTTLIALIIS